MKSAILNEALEHEQEIEDWLAELERMKQDFLKLCINISTSPAALKGK
ncbi:hypothetical protein [Prolixibacter sp. SD074]|nr:hypothetical protein [Prolixibacter sp. SD074]